MTINTLLCAVVFALIGAPHDELVVGNHIFERFNRHEMVRIARGLALAHGPRRV